MSNKRRKMKCGNCGFQYSSGTNGAAIHNCFQVLRERVKKLENPWKSIKRHPLVPDGEVLIKDNTGKHMVCVAPCGLIRGTTDANGNLWFATDWMAIPL